MAKVKLKSNKSAAKRFKKTGTGKYKHRQSFRSHMSTSKRAKRMRQLRHLKVVCASDTPSIRQMLPNG